jgi:hypothetical protein
MVVGGTVEDLTMIDAARKETELPYDPMPGGDRLREESRVP